MTDTPVEYHRSRYDAPRKKGFMGVSPMVWLITLGTVLAMFVALIIFLQRTKFEMKVMDYSDDAVDVEIIPPPPPPPPVNLETVKKEDRIEVAGPAVITRTPPEPAPVAAPPRPPVISNPSWNRRPAGEFPERALSRGIEAGSAVLECTVNPNGSVSSCVVISETPSGAGFGQAAIAGARRAQLTPRSVDGVATGGKVRFTTRFGVE